MRKFSPLETLALAEMSEEARIAKLAYICRRDHMQPNSLARSKYIIEATGEPRGAKGRLTVELRDEFTRQRRLNHARKCKRNQRYCGQIGKDWRGNKFYYDPVAWRQDNPWANNKIARTEAIVLSRFAEHAGNLIEFHGYLQWWEGTVRNYAVSAATIKDGEYFMLVKPWKAWVGGRSVGGKVQWFCYKTKNAVGSVRVPPRVGTFKGAIESLKSAAVKKAEEKGAVISIDWENEAFIVQSLRRKKARSIPFKQHERRKNRK